MVQDCPAMVSRASRFAGWFLAAGAEQNGEGRLGHFQTQTLLLQITLPSPGGAGQFG